jgi:hypothetical protein
MIAAWMLYSIVLGALMVVAAVPVERLVRANGGASRRVWATALCAAVLLPLIGMVLKDSAAAVEVGNRLVVSSPSAGIVMSGVDTLARLDGMLLSMWMVVSTLLASALVGGLGATAVRARRWRAGDVDGYPVLVSRDVGPAVVGVLRTRIVVPRWALALDPDQRAMMLRHEQEHVRAGDPGLLLFVALVLVALPWNPALWYLATRLRLAVELDCDRRVLRERAPDLRSYAELLLSVGARQSRLACGVGFSLGRPFLEERIDSMTSPRTRGGWGQALLVTVGLVGVLAAAWSLPQPVRAAKVGTAVPMCETDLAGLTAQVLEGFDKSS